MCGNMKSESRKMPVSETRKIRKPLMEKKRRARINDSLETLKQILLDSKTALKETSTKKAGQRTAKLEKADILEMTVHYIQNLKKKLDTTQPKPNCAKEEILIRPADSTSNRLNVGITLVPTRLGNGELAFIIPPTVQEAGHKKLEENENVWRPW